MRHFLLLLAPLLFVPMPGDSGIAQTAAGLSASDRAEGAKAHPQLVAQFGGAYDGPQAAYVRSVGQRIAMQSGLATRPGDYTVTLLNSNANNAFAIPGGYVYVTRQLVALMNDEAELAFVMGHEIGHVAARHAQKREQRAGLVGLGAALLGAVTGSSIVGQLASTGGGLYTLSFSRDQEREADSLGVRYLTRAGYDPLASGDILASLGAQTSLESRLAGKAGAEPVGWLSTHPANAERVKRIRKEAATFVAKAGPRATNRDAFLNAIDGMAYDDDPAQGIVRGSSFRHQGLGIAFDAPAGFALENGPSAVNGSKAGAGKFQFSGGTASGLTMTSYADKVWQAAGAPATELRPTRINGIDAGIGQTQVSTRSGTVDATLAVYRFGPDSYYHLLTVAPAGGGPVFAPLINSVRRMTATDAVRSRRVAVISVRPGDSIASLAARMAYDDDRQARFLTLNGLTTASRLTVGDRVKLIVLR